MIASVATLNICQIFMKCNLSMYQIDISIIYKYVSKDYSSEDAILIMELR